MTVHLSVFFISPIIMLLQQLYNYNFVILTFRLLSKLAQESSGISSSTFNTMLVYSPFLFKSMLKPDVKSQINSRENNSQRVYESMNVWCMVQTTVFINTEWVSNQHNMNILHKTKNICDAPEKIFHTNLELPVSGWSQRGYPVSILHPSCV